MTTKNRLILKALKLSFDHNLLVEQKLREQAAIDRGVDEASKIFMDVMSGGVGYSKAGVRLKPFQIELLNDSSSDTKAEEQDEAIYFTTSSLSLCEQCLRSKAWRLAYLQNKINAAHAAKE